MIRVENIVTPSPDQWWIVTQGMRNPMNSWDKSDSDFEVANMCDYNYILGDGDLGLMHRLYAGGSEHRKFARQLPIHMDITAPLYWWKEFSTYKVGTTANSCSTMHRIHSKEFTLDDFSYEHLQDMALEDLTETISVLNWYRDRYIKDKSKKDWWQMIQLLPSSYNQKRTVSMSYETAINMINQRRGHKLDEWNKFVSILEDLPHMKEIREGVE